MTLKPTVQLSQGQQFFFGKVPALSHGGIKKGGSVSLAEDEAVSFGPAGIGGIVSQMTEIEGCHDFY